MIKCKKCGLKNKIYELQELKSLEEFEFRFLIIGFCFNCKTKIIELVEKRTSDNKVFISKYYGDVAEKIVKREKKRLKNRLIEANKFRGFVYGINKEIRNKKGEITQIRQYAADYSSGEKELIKVINYNLSPNHL